MTSPIIRLENVGLILKTAMIPRAVGMPTLIKRIPCISQRTENLSLVDVIGDIASSCLKYSKTSSNGIAFIRCLWCISPQLGKLDTLLRMADQAISRVLLPEKRSAVQIGPRRSI